MNERHETVRKLHAEGLVDREIAERIGTTRAAVAGIRARLGIPALAPCTSAIIHRKMTDEELREWLAEGLSVRQIAEHTGANSSTVNRRILAMRLKTQGRELAITEGALDTDERFLAAFRQVSYAPPVHSRMAETSNRDGHIYGLPVSAFTVSSIYGA